MGFAGKRSFSRLPSPSPSPLLPPVLRSPPIFAQKRLQRAESPTETLATQATSHQSVCLLAIVRRGASHYFDTIASLQSLPFN